MAFAYEGNRRLTNMTPSLLDNSTSGNGTDLSHLPQVHLYTVLACVVIMLSFGIMGSLSSLALLLSARCKSTIRSMDYGLPFGLAAVDLLLCLTWIPIEIFRLGLNHVHIGYPSFLCYLDVTLFYFCISAIVLIIFFIALHRLLVCLSIQTVARTYAVRGLVTSALLAALLTIIVLYEYGRTVDYNICTQTPGLPLANASYVYLPIVLVNGAYALVMGIICVCLVGIVVKQKQKLNPHLQAPVVVKSTPPIATTPINTSEKLKTKELSDKELSDKSQENESSHCSVRFMEPSCSKERSNNSSKTASKESFFSRPFLGFTRDCKKADKSGDDSDLDDDEFDQKMMKKLQKTASGRRHTVANIGLGESMYGTKKEGFGSRSPSPNPTNYQYVRKWSVDIVALQDQLENPKKIYETSSFSEFKRFREKRDLDENKIEEEKHDDKDNENAKRKEREGKANAVKFGSCQQNCEELNTKTKSAESNQPQDNNDNREACATKKAILVDKSTTQTSPTVEQADSTDKGEDKTQEKTTATCVSKPANDTKVMNNTTTVVSALKNSSSRDKDKFECRISENVDVIEDGIESGGDCDDADDDADVDDDDEQEEAEEEEEILEVPVANKKELIRELQLHTTCLLLVLVALVCTLPFCLLQLMQEFMQPTLNRNATYVTSAIVLVQLPIHTLIIAWLERKLWIALRHLRVALTHLTCVCYCNIGKGRQCFGRPHYNGKSATV